MTRYLLLVSLGPMQGFISAARRTRDFWMGSALLSECAKAVAREFMRLAAPETSAPRCEQLIFPAVDAAMMGELRPLDLEKGELSSSFDVTNIVLAIMEGTGGQLRELDGQLQVVAQQAWRELAAKAGSRHGRWLRDDWREQLDERLIELNSVWVPLVEDSRYGEAREAALRLLGGRKACRDFDPWNGKAGVPKSSLDGARESVLLELSLPASRRGLRVKPKEQLDLIGLTKRVDWGHDSIRFPSVSRIAIAPFLSGAARLAETNAVVQCKSTNSATRYRCGNAAPSRLVSNPAWRSIWRSSRGSARFDSRERPCM